ncbi:MAG TPA: ATP-dependent RecD-like DNA helicase [Candidatus Magasanikbacteria bacterium]|nr:ATP-dependent RecD-like DNA helicase [Candidatus Magasanikbacteria bacterium]
MNQIDSQILTIDENIQQNIEKFSPRERGLLSQNILSQLRNFVEHISLKAYCNGKDIENTYENIVKAIKYVETRGDLKVLSKFHYFLQKIASHYTLEQDASERLMLKYYEYLLRTKAHVKKAYRLDVLKNIDQFPLDTDSNLREYREKIAERINRPESDRERGDYYDRYYIQKIRPFFVKYEIYYEVTFTTANDWSSKFDRIIAFTKFDISQNYAVKLSVNYDTMEVLGKKMPIQIIDGWEVSIRPCELNNFADIFGPHSKISGGNLEYRKLMSFLTESGFSLSQIIGFESSLYNEIKARLTQGRKVFNFFDILDKCRTITNDNQPGTNVIRYLLHRLNNKVIKRQYRTEECGLLSSLRLDYGCIPFDQMPFNSSLKNHNPKISDLFDCIDFQNREHEFFARLIKNNTEIEGGLYTPKADISGFSDASVLMDVYNGKLYYKHTHRRLEIFNNHIFIKGYEQDTLDIIKRLRELSSDNIDNYSNSVTSWLNSSAYKIDCEDKKIILTQAFENSRVALIYGSAGTGKSTLINHISNFFSARSKLYLANTNPAVDNLKRKVDAAGCEFKTIAKFLSWRNTDIEYDLLVIDECSTVSNSDMVEILKKARFKLLILVGDVFQIESIIFGNWFSVARSFVPKTSVFELVKPYRSTNEKLITLWDKVRNIEDDISEHIAKNGYSVVLDQSIFESFEEDEIILCLNYDGLYGINNINRFLQSSNSNPVFQWGIQTYKVNDPVLFNETDRFAPLIYNNLKGRIIDIEKFEDKIRFDIEIDRALNQLDVEGYDFELMSSTENGNSVIRFYVNKFESSDDDDDSSIETVVPFQIAYAVSIHKAQGLEYDSVKIVITNEIEEMITHNIFYTAITRAKEKLKIYWSAETQNTVLKSLKKRDGGKDVALLSAKFNL